MTSQHVFATSLPSQEAHYITVMRQAVALLKTTNCSLLASASVGVESGPSTAYKSTREQRDEAADITMCMVDADSPEVAYNGNWLDLVGAYSDW